MKIISKALQSILAIAALILWVSAALAADIQGTWITEDGSKISIEKCGSGFCMKPVDGEFAGRSIGRFVWSNEEDEFEGSVLDPETNKRYQATIEPHQNTLELTGCTAIIFCQSETWRRAK